MRIILGVTLILLLVYVLVFGLLYSFQESLIFQADILEKDYSFEFDTPFEEKKIQREDGAELHGLYFKTPQPRGLILYFHGNAGDLSRWGNVVEPFVKLGYEVLVVDYRGYGKSTGKRSEKLMYEDALKWYDLALEKMNNESIVVYGRSLGCTFATFAASKRNCNQLILETPFYSLKSVVKNTYAIFPVGSLLKFRFPTFEFIDLVNCPITIIHGTEDDIVPIENSQRLIELNPLIDFVTINEGEHNNLAKFEHYWQVVGKLLP
ncbi:MAG: alpha/beta hydrolase [Vicingaceae bacterium]